MTAPDLAAFLLARLADDETNARQIQNCEWFHGVDSDVEREIMDFADPARVLREVEAKRAIVEAHPQVSWGMKGRTGFGCLNCREMVRRPEFVRAIEEPIPSPCPTLRHLASVYRDHPEFDEAWLP